LQQYNGTATFWNDNGFSTLFQQFSIKYLQLNTALNRISG